MRLENCEVELVICKRGQSMIIFIGFLIKKMEKKMQWDVGSQGLFGKALSEVVHICLENWFFSKYKS